ncbi:hypothetical protein Tco_0124018, partial [Tanacetum coccineum]
EIVVIVVIEGLLMKKDIDETGHVMIGHEAYSSGAEDIGHDHIPTVNLRQSWWKPLTKDRPATPEPTWTIPSSDLTVPTKNWASALKFTYAPPPENSLLAQIGDMATFMDCSKWKNATNFSPISSSKQMYF